MNTPEEYIKNLPADRREIFNKLREAIRVNLPAGFEEGMQYGMITYYVPLATYPAGYKPGKGQPLPFISLASQKNYLAIYHMGIYQDKKLLEWFEESWGSLGIGKLDIGKSCIRLKKLDKIPYQLLGELAGKMTVSEFIDIYERRNEV